MLLIHHNLSVIAHPSAESKVLMEVQFNYGEENVIREMTRLGDLVVLTSHRVNDHVKSHHEFLVMQSNKKESAYNIFLIIMSIQVLVLL